MDEKIITLTDGTKLEVKVNFMTLYLIQKHGLDKVINKEALSEDENMEAAAKLIYIILRSNGLKVDEDEALILTPMDPEVIRAKMNFLTRIPFFLMSALKCGRRSRKRKWV